MKKMILTPELEEAIKRSAVTDLLLQIEYAIINRYYDSDDLSLYNELIELVETEANFLRDKYKKDRVSK